MLTIILAEAELEFLPARLKHHPQAQAVARARDRRASRTILDSSVHNQALMDSDLPDKERRGRPDLVHFSMLLALDSVLNQKRGLRFFVHTRHDELITVDAATRIMRHYPRWIGLMEKLLHEGATPRQKPLLTCEEGWRLTDVLTKHALGPVLVMDEAGAATTPRALAQTHAASDATLVLGAFPHGSYHTDFAGVDLQRVSFGTQPQSVWTILGNVLAQWEDVTGAYPADREPTA